MKPPRKQIEARSLVGESVLWAACGSRVQKRQSQPVAAIGLLAGPDHARQGVLGREAVDGLDTDAKAGAHRFTLVADQAHSRERLVAHEGGQAPLVALHSRIGAVFCDTENTLSFFSSSGKLVFFHRRKDFLRVLKEFVFWVQKPVAILSGIGVEGRLSGLISCLHERLKSKLRAIRLQLDANFVEARDCNGFRSRAWRAVRGPAWSGAFHNVRWAAEPSSSI